MMKWYDVNNKKPDIGQRVLIADDCADQVIIGTYTEDEESDDAVQIAWKKEIASTLYQEAK